MLKLGRWVPVLSVLALFAAGPACAHVEAAHSEWGAEPWLAALLVIAGVLYARGMHRLTFAAHSRPQTIARSAGSFWLGWSALAAALVWPLPAATEGLFSAHMIQHELMMAVAAPLMVLGRPLAIWTWAFPARARKSVARPFRIPAVERIWRSMSAAAPATMLHALAIWVWHVPRFFELAEKSVAIHALQHTAFLGSALLFWWAVLKPTRRRSGPAIACLFVTMLHTGALGVLLTFANDVWYPASTAGAAVWGLTPLEDQQLGELVMWVPGGIPYVVAALVLAAKWLMADSPGPRYEAPQGASTP